MAELGELHASLRDDLTSLLRELGTEAVADRPVPACPGWSVKDVVAHLAGVEADILAGNLDGVATDAWTAAHVDARRDLTLDEVLEQWSVDSPQVEAISSAFGPVEAQWLMDELTHVNDVRGALGLPMTRDSAALDPSIDFLADGLHRKFTGTDQPTPVFAADGRSWPPKDGATATTTATAPDRVELLRALTGRRSVDQVAAWDWSDDPVPYLGAFSWGPFAPRSEPLEE